MTFYGRLRRCTVRVSWCQRVTTIVDYGYARFPELPCLHKGEGIGEQGLVTEQQLQSLHTILPSQRSDLF